LKESLSEGHQPFPVTLPATNTQHITSLSARRTLCC